MQFSVPQFVEIEDKIIGPLTLKQFLILLAGGLLEFFYYSLFKAGVIFYFLSLPTVFVFVYLAFGRFNGRPAIFSFGPIFKFLTASKYRVFERTGEATLALTKKTTPQREAMLKPGRETVGSRLKRLAYLLDEKTAEEERLIHSGEIQKKWLNQI